MVHDITATVLNGFSPFLITLFITLSGSAIVPGVYIAIVAGIAWCSVRALAPYEPEKANRAAENAGALA